MDTLNALCARNGSYRGSHRLFLPATTIALPRHFFIGCRLPQQDFAKARSFTIFLNFAIERHRQALQHLPNIREEYLITLEKQGLSKTVEATIQLGWIESRPA
ncbi:MAG: hypothetical protein ACKVZH_19425 [Blastocatellia bacterium]